MVSKSIFQNPPLLVVKKDPVIKKIYSEHNINDIYPKIKLNINIEDKKLILEIPAECILFKKTEFFHSEIVILTKNITVNGWISNIAVTVVGLIVVDVALTL
ncbi:hypothetical protein [Mesoplasma entomophilum]|uniref:hypothetical protein n=1 Tax=Mesoplasma entomophilum TaxID=2149 RepID=UPI0013E05B68|nr:hypothetical protein [Mesoplasma entomophilum]